MNVTMWEHGTVDRFLDVANFTTLTPSSLLTTNGISGIYQIHVSVPHRSCPSYHQFYPLLRHEHSEQ
jgi:hypothetical protein